MKKIFFAAGLCCLIFGCNGNQNNNEKNEERDSLQSVIDQKDSEINEMMGALSEIQEGFNLINEAEGRVNMMKDNAEGNSIRENIMENMQFIQQTLADNKQKIQELESKLKSGSISAAKLRETLANLQKQLEEKTKDIEELRATLEAKDVKIAELDQAVATLQEEKQQITEQRDQTEQIARNQDAQLNTAWYVYGTSKELKAHNILIKGDVLQGDYDKDYFIKIDIRKTTVIPFNSKSAELLTNHPAGSYTLLKDSKGEYTLRITNATQFWSVSKYLVVKVK